MKFQDIINPAWSGIKSSTLVFTAGVAAIFSSLSPEAAASTIAWNLPGDGDWDIFSPNWSGDATVFEANGTVDVNFNTSANTTITVGINMVPKSTTLNPSAGNLTLTGGPIAGVGNLIKNGNGTAVFGIAPTGPLIQNTYSGGTEINAGTLRANFPSITPFGSGPVTLNNGTLYLWRITASNELVVNGGLVISSNGFGNNWDGPMTLNSDLAVQCDFRLNANGVISGSSGIIKTGDNELNLNGTNDYTGDTVVNAGTLGTDGNSIDDSGKLVIDGGVVKPTGTETVDTLYFGTEQQVAGTWGASGSGATHFDDVRFAGVAGVVNVLNGIPQADADILTFGLPGAPAVINGTTISWVVPDGTDVTSLAPTFDISFGAVATPVSGTVRDFTSPQTYSLDSGDGTVLNKNYTVTVTESAVPTSFIWNSATSGNWSDAAKWTNDLLSGTAPGALGGPFYLLNFDTPGSYTATNDQSADFQTNQLNFGGAVTLSGNRVALTADGPTLPQINQNSASGVTIGMQVNLDADTTYGGSGGGQISITNEISGTGSLTKAGTSTLVVGNSAGNSYSGGTIIDNGTLRANHPSIDPFGSGPVTLNGGTLYLWRVNPTNALTIGGGTIFSGNGFGNTWSGPVTLNADATLQSSFTLRITGDISGAGGIIKNNNGPLNLSGDNDFTGAVTVNAGSLAVTSLNSVSGGTATSNLGAPATVADGTISLGNNGSLQYSGAGETTDRVIELTGTNGEVLIQAGTASGLPTTRGVSGLLKFTSDISIPGTPAANNSKTLVLTHTNNSDTGANPGDGELSGSIGDSLTGNAGQLSTSVSKEGNGTWTLSGTNSYSGDTSVESGTLALARIGALGGGDLDITSGAMVRLDYIGTREISALTFDGGAAEPAGTYGSSETTADFQDDTRFAGPGLIRVGASSSPASATALALTSGSEPSNGGDVLTFTATVTGAAPTGSVLFYNGVTLIGTSELNGSQQAGVSIGTLDDGTHEITALYLGDGGNSSSTSTPLTQTVVDTRPASTTTLALSSGSNPSPNGAAVTFTATVTGSSPTGSVYFYDGETQIGSDALDGSGEAELTTSALAPGWRPITARYEGDATHMSSGSGDPLFLTVNPPAGGGKLKVFILAGQSNMVGTGRVETGRDPNNLSVMNVQGGLGSLRNLLNRDPERYGYLADPVNPVGGNPGWITRDDVWVTYWGDTNAENRRGDLDPYFGGNGNQERMGPEYSFGLEVGSQLGDQVLIIKYAFGGKSLEVDYRPPSSGGTVGPFYTDMIARVNQVLGDISSFFPGYAGQGYEIAGFGWHQGWNDLGQATPAYEANLTNLINDVRAEFSLPDLPVVVAITGQANGNASTVLQAQLNVGNPALHPEFAGTVTSVDTRPFDYGTLLGGSSEGFHWNWNCESYFNMGQSMGQAMLALQPPVLVESAFGSWASDPEQGLTEGVNDGPLDDPDFDNIGNLLEFTLGGDPLVADYGILPILSNPNGGAWTFEYNRSVISRPTATTQIVEYGSDLVGWTEVPIPLNSAGSVTITQGVLTDLISVELPNLGDKGFARLKVEE